MTLYAPGYFGEKAGLRIIADPINLHWNMLCVPGNSFTATITPKVCPPLFCLWATIIQRWESMKNHMQIMFRRFTWRERSTPKRPLQKRGGQTFGVIVAVKE